MTRSDLDAQISTMELGPELLDRLRGEFPWLCGKAPIEIYTNLDVATLDRHGDPVAFQTVRNKVPNTGRNIVRDLLGRGVPGTGTGFAPTHMAVGTGTTAVADGDKKLVIEVYRAILDARLSFDSRLDLQMFLTTDDANGNTLTEAALFDNSTLDGGQMLSRALLGTPVTKTDAVQLILTWSHTIASA